MEAFNLTSSETALVFNINTRNSLKELRDYVAHNVNPSKQK